MANLRRIHVLSVTRYEQEMSRFRLGLCNLRVADVKWIPSSSTFMLPHFRSSSAKKRCNPLVKDRSVSWPRLSVSVM